jgi:glycine cleavage system transcriptional repressor
MSLVVRTQADKQDVEAALRPRLDAHELDVVVMELDESSPDAGRGEAFVLSVHGADQVGIVAAMTRVLADHGANITDLTTRLAGDLYLLIAEAQVPQAVDGAALEAAVAAKASELGVEARWRAAETDLL